MVLPECLTSELVSVAMVSVLPVVLVKVLEVFPQKASEASPRPMVALWHLPSKRLFLQPIQP